MVMGLILAKCTNGALTASIVSGVYVAYRFWNVKNRKVAVIVILICSLLAVGGFMKFVHLGSYPIRLKVYVTSLDLVYAKPLLGWGIGQATYTVPIYLNGDRQTKEVSKWCLENIYYQEDFKKLYTAKHTFDSGICGFWPQVHNDYEQWLIDTGLVGLFLLFMVFLSHFLAFIKTRKRDVLLGLSVLAILISANAFFTLQMGCFVFILTLFMGIIQGEYVSQRS
jgi:O-antigen ligase